MDAQQFLAEFGHIANAPGGVARLREMILDLAIRAKLVLSDSTLSSRALLLQIRKFRAELVKSGKLRRPTPLPAIEPSELSFQLPSN